MTTGIKTTFSYVWAIALALGTTACGGSKTTTYSVLPDSAAFTQSASEVNSKIDILWVIDNSGSMDSSQQNLVNNFSSFIQKFQAKGYDFQMAVTVTEAWRTAYNNNAIYVRNKNGGPFGTSGVRVLTPSTPNLDQAFMYNARQGVTGSGDERAFQSFRDSLNYAPNIADGFPRKDAFLAVIIISDEDDFSNDTTSNISGSADPYADVRLHTVDSYVNFLDQYTAAPNSVGRRFNVNAITIMDTACLQTLQDSTQRIGKRYIEIAQKTEGKAVSICGNFADSLTEISSRIIELSTMFYLGRVPVEGSIKVKVNDVVIPNDGTNGWVYVPSSNAISFKGTAVPPQGAKIIIDFDPQTI